MHFIGLILNDQSMDAFHVFIYFDLIILNSGNVCQSFHTLRLWRFLINQLQALFQIRLQSIDRTKFCLFFFNNLFNWGILTYKAVKLKFEFRIFVEYYEKNHKQAVHTECIMC